MEGPRFAQTRVHARKDLPVRLHDARDRPGVMAHDDFARRRRAKENLKSAIPGAPPAVYRASVSNGATRFRVYRIDPIPGGWWRCEVWASGRGGLHRTQDVPTRADMKRLQGQYEYEVAELLRDGWALDE